MKPPKNFDRYLGIAQRLLIRGRLPALLLGVARKTSKRGLKLGEARKTLGLFHQLLLAWWRGEYRGVSRKTLLTVAGGLVYFLLPIDLIPDWVPMFGLLDDLAVLAWVGKACSDELDGFRAWRANRTASQQAALAALPDRHEQPAAGVALDQLRD
ncbi:MULTISPECIES: YkvA family protein [unclassified Pseudomonas]|uniref:YkvA family protein n=1 Tax=unclassified Pseudomonas TaxID=196821 RepID=UPI00131CF3B0|nr:MULTISPECIES: YkvA family protein [unclassified Pseudomonas]